MEFEQKREDVLRRLRAATAEPAGRLAVAFSGGVDSTLLLALARDALGAERVLAVTARSESLAAAELEACRRIAAALGVRLVLLRTTELARAGYRENAPDRCYHCKAELFERIEAECLAAEGIVRVAYGATACDLADHRPGMQAAAEHAVLAPLADAGLDKADVRELSRRLGLETWDKPAQPCLASRIPYGQEVTAPKLRRIDEAEALLRRLGLRELRVRHHEERGVAGSLARIEVPASELAALLAPGRREEVVAGLRALGFAYVTLDLEGFRSGRQNEVLATRRLPVRSSSA